MQISLRARSAGVRSPPADADLPHTKLGEALLRFPSTLASPQSWSNFGTIRRLVASKSTHSSSFITRQLSCHHNYTECHVSSFLSSRIVKIGLANSEATSCNSLSLYVVDTADKITFCEVWTCQARALHSVIMLDTPPTSSNLDLALGLTKWP